MTSPDWWFVCAAGACKALRDVSAHPSLQWLWRFERLVQWRDTHAKFLLWPLDMWHCTDALGVILFARSLCSWEWALILTTAYLAAFQVLYFCLWERPLVAFSTWLRKLAVPREDYTIK